MEIVKKRIISDDTGFPVTVNANKTGTRYMKEGCRYNSYITCSRCINASWYDEDYCNNQMLTFLEKNNSRTVQVYCENYEPTNLNTVDKITDL